MMANEIAEKYRLSENERAFFGEYLENKFSEGIASADTDMLFTKMLADTQSTSVNFCLVPQKNTLQNPSISVNVNKLRLRFLFYLTKNPEAHLPHNICAVSP